MTEQEPPESLIELWSQYTGVKENKAVVPWGVFVLAVGIVATGLMIAAMRVDDLERSQFFQFIAGLAGFMAFIAAGMRVFAHRRSHWIDFWGKVLGAWAALIAVLSLAAQGSEVWPF